MHLTWQLLLLMVNFASILQNACVIWFILVLESCFFYALMFIFQTVYFCVLLDGLLCQYFSCEFLTLKSNVRLEVAFSKCISSYREKIMNTCVWFTIVLCVQHCMAPVTLVAQNCWLLCPMLLNTWLSQQNSYSVSHLLGTVTTQWLDSDCVVTVITQGLHSWSTVESPCCRHLTTLTTPSLSSHYVITAPSRWLME